MNICENCINNEVCPNDANLIYQVDVNGHTHYKCPDEIWVGPSKYHAKWREEHKGNTFIRLIGCDDTTEFTMELSDDEFVFLRKVAEKANKTSTYGCMPTMTVKPIKRKV